MRHALHSADLRDKLESKLSFYEMCDKYGIPYPKTFVVRPSEWEQGVAEADLTEEKIGFKYPIIVKPSMSST